MVVRATDTSRDLVGVVREARARTSELARRQGRGAGALRNGQGQAVEVDPGSGTPMLVAYAEGVPTGTATKFTTDGIEIVDPVDGESRDLKARSLRTDELLITNNAIKCIPYDGALRFSSTDGALEVANRDGTQLRGIRTNRLHANDIDSNGDINAANGIRAENGLSCGGDFAVGARARATNWSSSTADGAINWDGTGALRVMNYAGNAYRGVYASNFAPPPSWRGIKIDQRSAAEFLGATYGEVVDGLDLAWSWTYDRSKQSFDDGTREQIGLKLDELPDPLIERHVDEETGEDRSTYDVAKLLNVALGALQETRAEVRELRAEVARLRRTASGADTPA